MLPLEAATTRLHNLPSQAAARYASIPACLPSLPPLPLSRLLCILRACLPNCISLIFIFAHTHTATHTHTHTPTETQPSQTLRSRRLCQQSRPLRVLYELPLGTRHKVKISLQNFPIITCQPLLPLFPFPFFVLPLPGCCFLLQLSLSLHSETTRPPPSRFTRLCQIKQCKFFSSAKKRRLRLRSPSSFACTSAQFVRAATIAITGSPRTKPKRC